MANELQLPPEFYNPFYDPQAVRDYYAGQAIAGASPMDLRPPENMNILGPEEWGTINELAQGFIPRPGLDEWEAFQTVRDTENPGWVRGLAGAGLLAATVPGLYGLGKIASKYPAMAARGVMRQGPYQVPGQVGREAVSRAGRLMPDDTPSVPTPRSADEFQLVGSLPPERYATVSSWEPNPGRFGMKDAEDARMSLGNANQKLRGYAPDPLYNNPQYQQGVLDAMTGPGGEDLFLQAMGLGDNPLQQGPGVWEGSVTRGGQSLLMDPDMDKLEAAEALRGALLGQRAMGQYTPRDVPLEDANILRYQTGRDLTPYDAGLIDQTLQSRFGGDAGVVPVPGGYDIRSFDDIPPEDLLAAGRELQPSNLMRPMAADFGTTSRYTDFEKAWQNPEMGEVFGEALSMLDKSDLASRVDDPALRAVAGRLLSNLRQTGTSQGGIRNALEALTTEGLEGLRRLVAEGKLPAAILVPFGIGEVQDGEQL